jgi:hypothetical protein
MMNGREMRWDWHLWTTKVIHTGIWGTETDHLEDQGVGVR